MKIGLITARFQPETSPGAKRANDLAAALKTAGHDVTVLTQLPSYPDPSAFDYEAPKDGRPLIETQDDVGTIWRFTPRIASKDDLVARLKAEAHFCRQASRANTGLADFHGVVASAPFTFNLVAAQSYGVPMWLDVRDLTWEYVRELGRRSPLKRAGGAFLRSIALRRLRAASGVSTTTRAQRQYLIDRAVRAERVEVVPNGVPREVIDELGRLRGDAQRSIRTDGGPLRVVYAGLLGFPQGLEFAVESIAEMSGDDVELHLFGAGAEQKKLAELCRSRELRHVHLHGHVAYDEYLRAISSADVLFASLRPEVQTAMPSKLLEYMAAEKPILFAGSGEPAETLEEISAGFAVPYGETRALQERITELLHDASLRQELGARGREWVCHHRVREDVNRSWVESIETALSRPAPVIRRSSGSNGERSVGRSRPIVRAASLAAAGVEAFGILRALERLSARDSDQLRVLTYHRVTDLGSTPSPCPGLVSATPESFAKQMDFLARSYRVVSLDEVLEAVRGERSLPRRAVLVTFDDAYRDFAEHAFPVLERLGLPSTLFVPTAYPDNPDRAFWWDRLYQSISRTKAQRLGPVADSGELPLGTPAERTSAFRQLRDTVKEKPHGEAMELVDRICAELGPEPAVPGVLGWEALRDLSRRGVSLAAHTRTHPHIDQISQEEIRAEVSGSLEDLARETGSRYPIFAYPAGRTSPKATELLREAGIEIAFTTSGAIHDMPRGDPLMMARLNVGLRMNRAAFRAQLLGVRPPSWLLRKARRRGSR